MRRLALLASGVGSALVSLALLTASVAVVGVDGAAWVAMLGALAAYAGQILTSLYVEIPLAGSPERQLRIPPIVAWIALAGSMLTVVGALVGSLEVSILASLVFLSIAEPSRSVALSRFAVRSEFIGGLAVGAAAIWGYIAPSRPVLHVWIPLALAIAIGCRLVGVGVARGRPLRVSRGGWWVLGETLLTGATQPFITSLALSAIGPSGAVTYRAVVSVGNAFSPLLNMTRIRLLVRHSRADIWFAIIAGLLTAGAVVLLHWSGVFGEILGEVWGGVDWVLIALLILWRIATFWSTLPFAALRRRGRTRRVFVARMISTAGYWITTLIAIVVSPTVTSLLVAVVISEALAVAIYLIAQRRMQ